MKTVSFPVIGFAGTQDSGKTTAASIVEKYGYKRSSFAAPLKAMCRAIDIPEKNITGTLADKNQVIDIRQGRDNKHMGLRLLASLGIEIKNLDAKSGILFGKTPNEALALMDKIGLFDVDTSRKFQQLLGTEWGRAIEPNFWVNYWNKTVFEPNRKIRYVIDDIRFPNELAIVKVKKGISIKVFTETESFNQGISGHASEQANLLKCDASIFNWKIDKRHFENQLLELLDYMS